jgi:hypothetical protein
MAVQRQLSKQGKDYLGAAAMIALGAGVAFQGVRYDVGSLKQMGPGFFPTALGVALAFVGLAIALSAWVRGDKARLALPPAQWRGWLCITLAMVAFVALGKYGGLLPATFAAVFIAAIGDRQNTLVNALSLAGAVTVIGILVFWWALKLQIPLVSWG